MAETFTAYHESEVGILEIIGTEQVIKSVRFIDPAQKDTPLDAGKQSPAVSACFTQLDEYFHGERRDFSLDLEPEGTIFQKSVWHELLNIPYGQTVSYLDVAKAINNEKAIRAVGAANGQNPIAIIIPCHRVIGNDGKLTGYGGGLWRKEFLLQHEGYLKPSAVQLSLL